MKKTAVLLYESFCNFEFSVLLEILAINKKPVVFFAKEILPIISEEGLKVIPDIKIEDLDISEFDSLILTGAADIRKAIEDEEILSFIKKFDERDYIIGAISIAPILLLKAGILSEKSFMAGVNKEELYEEGFSEKDLTLMIDWNESIKNPVPNGYIKDGNIITSVSYEFVRWGIEVAKKLGLNVNPLSFGIKE
ncbi:DJ-1/PfpI family protein [Pseudoleptotrichia goodfellowii]|uniref:DJ-1/PfpI family protein n=1 Tax=Pseudoleptotrichia goodfellowii TaxID=157692 RepID=A0A510JB19_9FUSO|nr:DJ-1/PfpI family protein [Pseudoleptotrichia goodfellowii]BBM36510.1 DJ-1/PfpI family protein [Pseudoleptotrichia goodfellowii]